MGTVDIVPLGKTRKVVSTTFVALTATSAKGRRMVGREGESQRSSGKDLKIQVLKRKKRVGHAFGGDGKNQDRNFLRSKEKDNRSGESGTQIRKVMYQEAAELRNLPGFYWLGNRLVNGGKKKTETEDEGKRGQYTGKT